MKYKIFVLLMALLLSTIGMVAGQTISEKTYPQQFGSPAAYQAATGQSIGMVQRGAHAGGACSCR